MHYVESSPTVFTCTVMASNSMYLKFVRKLHLPCFHECEWIMTHPPVYLFYAFTTSTHEPSFLKSVCRLHVKMYILFVFVILFTSVLLTLKYKRIELVGLINVKILATVKCYNFLIHFRVTQYQISEKMEST